VQFRLLKLSSANIKLSVIPQSLLRTNAAGIMPVNLGSTAYSILFSQMLHHYFSSSDAAKWIVLVASRMLWTGTCALNLLICRRWTKRSLQIWPCLEENINSLHFTSYLYLPLTKIVPVADRTFEDDLHLNVRQILFISSFDYKDKKCYVNIRTCIQMIA